MTILQRLRLLERLPLGSDVPREILGTETNWAIAISKLCGEAAFEIETLKALNYRLVAALKEDLRS